MPSSITLTVRHLPTSTSFFLSALQPLEYVFRGRQEQTVGFGPATPAHTPPDFWITQEIPGVPAGAAHVAFAAPSRRHVNAFFHAALQAGASIHGAPCQRDSAGYYSAAVIDFDGNSIEAVHRPAPADAGRTPGAERQATPARSIIAEDLTSVIVKMPSAHVGSPKTVVSTASSSKASSRERASPSVVTDTARSKTAPCAPQGDVFGVLINEARTAASVAKDLVNSVRPSSASSASAVRPFSGAPSGVGGTGASDAIVGTLLGVAAGAALQYALSSRSSKDSHAPPRHLAVVGRSTTDPVLSSRHFAGGSDFTSGRTGVHASVLRAIEPAPPPSYLEDRPLRDEKRMIIMHDRVYSESPRSDYASTVRASSLRRRRSADSYSKAHTLVQTTASRASSRHSGGSGHSNAPPSSFRGPVSASASNARQADRTRGDGSRSSSRASTARRYSPEDKSSPGVPQRSGRPHSVTSHVRQSRSPSVATSRSRRPDPDRQLEERLAPPSRASTWAGSDPRHPISVSVRSRVSSVKSVLAPASRSMTGRLGSSLDADERGSTISKQRARELAALDLSPREVQPEDSVSQVGSRSSTSHGTRRRRAK